MLALCCNIKDSTAEARRADVDPTLYGESGVVGVIANFGTSSVTGHCPRNLKATSRVQMLAHGNGSNPAQWPNLFSVYNADVNISVPFLATLTACARSTAGL